MNEAVEPGDAGGGDQRRGAGLLPGGGEGRGQGQGAGHLEEDVRA